MKLNFLRGRRSGEHYLAVNFSLLKFQGGGSSQLPRPGKAISGAYLELPSVKSCIPTSILMQLMSQKFFLNTGSIHIVLHEDSTAVDHLQCCFQACTLDYVIRTTPNSTKVITDNGLIYCIFLNSPCSVDVNST